jgi:hypothetical protein
MVGLLQAPIGTRLYKRMEQDKRLVGTFSGDNVDGATNIVPKGMSIEMLQKGYRAVMNTLYAPKNYYARVRTFLREYKAPKITIPINAEYIRAFFRSVIRLGVIGKERVHYWKLILWTLSRRPELFALAVTFAIYGYHFRQVMDLHLM